MTIANRLILLLAVPFTDATDETGGLGTAAPLQATAWPLLIRDTLLGVVEIATFRARAGRQTALIEELLPVAAMSLEVLQRNLRTQELLAQTQEQARQLEEQTEELTQSQAALLSQREELLIQHSALEAAANAIVITDRKGAIEWVNPAFTRLTGYAREEAIGQNPRVLNAGVHDREFFRNMWQTVLSGSVWQGTLTNKRKDGAHYQEEMTITPVRSKKGEVTHFVAVKQDITERMRQEAELARTKEMAIPMADGRVHDTLYYVSGFRDADVDPIRSAMNGRAIRIDQSPALTR